MKKLLKKLFIVIIFVLLSTILTVTARDCQEIEDINQQCDILIPTINGSNQGDIFTDAVCKFNVTDPTGSVSQTTMTPNGLATGYQNDSFTGAVEGIHILTVLCTKGGETSFNSAIITVGASDQTRLSELNDTSQIIVTDTAEIQANQSSFVTADLTCVIAQLQEINNTLLSLNVSTYQYFTSGSNEDQFKADLTALNNISVNDIFEGIIGNSSLSFNLTIGSMYQAIIINQSGLTANWSQTSTSNLTLTAADLASIAEEVRDINISNKCPWNSSALDDSLGQYIACGYQRGWQ